MRSEGVLREHCFLVSYHHLPLWAAQHPPRNCSSSNTAKAPIVDRIVHSTPSTLDVDIIHPRSRPIVVVAPRRTPALAPPLFRFPLLLLQWEPTAGLSPCLPPCSPLSSFPPSIPHRLLGGEGIAQLIHRHHATPACPLRSLHPVPGQDEGAEDSSSFSFSVRPQRRRTGHPPPELRRRSCCCAPQGIS